MVGVPALDLPVGFFSDLPTANLPGKPSPAASTWQPQKAMSWYDSIIDLMLIEPGISLKDIGAKLNKHPVTIGLIVRSDMFQARLAIRRAAYNEHLAAHTVQKLTKVAHKALDLTLEVMEKKGDTIPLKQVAEIATSALDKLGYGVPSRSESAPTQVFINNSSAAVASSSALERAREHMRTLQNREVAKSPTVLGDHQSIDSGRREAPAEGE